MDDADKTRQATHGAPSVELAPVEVVQSTHAPGGPATGTVNVSVQGGSGRIRVRGCASSGCCMAWIILVAMALLVGFVWLVKAIWVRV